MKTVSNTMKLQTLSRKSYQDFLEFLQQDYTAQERMQKMPGSQMFYYGQLLKILMK